MKTEIEQLRKEFNERIDALLKEETKEPKIKVGIWYKSDFCGGSLFLPTEIIDRDAKGYGFEQNEWCNKDFPYWAIKGKTYCMPATDKEVEDALGNECEKKYKDAVCVRCLATGNKEKLNVKGDFSFNSEMNCGYYKGSKVFDNGKWAEIIPEEKIMIGGYEVKKTASNSFQIGCKEFTSRQIQALCGLMESAGFKIVAFDGTTVTLETINKILNL